MEIQSMFRFETVGERSEVVFRHDRFDIGTCKLWLPEGIMTVYGSACVYPHGMDWHRDGNRLSQEAREEQLFGPGNCNEVEPGTLECCGIRFPKAPPLPWTATYEFLESKVEFSLTTRNPHRDMLSKVVGLLCFKFMDAPWWSDDDCFLLTRNGIRTISDLGRTAGLPNRFQAWLLEGETTEHPFTTQFWGVNPTRVCAPLWVVRCREAGCCVVVRCDSALYAHSNAGNPCNDLALKFGDLKPGAHATCRGQIRFTTRSVDEIFCDEVGVASRNV
jgi:hypothetical protein